MNKSIVLGLLLGSIQLTQAHDHNHVKCPYGHKHPALKNVKPHGFRWGMLEMLDENGEKIDDLQTDSRQSSSKYDCPIKKWWESKVEYYTQYSHLIKEFSVEADQHHECPFMKHFMQSTLNANKNQEHHKTPFYDPSQPEEIKNTTEWVSNGVPTAVFHGFGDACVNPGDINFEQIIKQGTGAEVKCIEVGIPSLGEVFNNFEYIAKVSCQKIAQEKIFQGEFNVVGLSQGGLLARYIAQECDMPGKVRNMLTIGGPHMGVDAVPNCINGFICDIVNFVAKKLVYLGLAQNWVAPAGYFRDVNNYGTYLKKSVFLPALNNENTHGKTRVSGLIKDRFTDLNSVMLVMFDQDTVIYPKETAWFQSLDKQGNVLPLNATDFYQQDYIGLKKMTEEGKVQFVTLDGNHLQFTTQDVQNIFIPFLNQ